jgi:hypothetical protein
LTIKVGDKGGLDSGMVLEVIGSDFVAWVASMKEYMVGKDHDARR